MAKAKKKQVKKPAKKPARAKAKPARAKAKPTTKHSKAKPAPASTATLSPIETEVAKLLADYEAGNIDNVWDVLPRTSELDTLLPKSSTLWKAYNQMSMDLGEIARKSEMGED